MSYIQQNLKYFWGFLFSFSSPDGNMDRESFTQLASVEEDFLIFNTTSEISYQTLVSFARDSRLCSQKHGLEFYCWHCLNKCKQKRH